MPPLSHMTATLALVPASFAFARLSDAAFVGGWSLGSMNLRLVAAGVYRGVSLFDGSEAFVEILPSPALGLIDFAIGTLEARAPRISIRVTEGNTLGYDDGVCHVALHALRSATADDDRWARTCTTHETEILLIKAQLEAAFSGDGTDAGAGT
jgi:hypothetical protein